MHFLVLCAAGSGTVRFISLGLRKGSSFKQIAPRFVRVGSLVQNLPNSFWVNVLYDHAHALRIV